MTDFPKAILTFMLMMNAYIMYASSVLPATKPVYIEVRCDDRVRWRPKYGTSYQIGVKDIYTKEMRFQYAEPSEKSNAVYFEFEAYNPIYDVITLPNGNIIPFYIEPGDSLIINIDYLGKPESYKRTDGYPARYSRMMHHDISNSKLYSTQEFEKDRERYNFTGFAKQIMDKAKATVDSINRIADHYSLSDKERKLAICNARLQYFIWIYEYAQFKSHQLEEYARKHKDGWKNRESQDEDMGALRNPDNYSFMRSIPVNDSVCLGSRFFDTFMSNYESSEILKYDQHMYYGESGSDSIRMDSVIIARDMQICGLTDKSLMADVMMQRRHMVVPDDYGFWLKEVRVYADRTDPAEKSIVAACAPSEEMMHNVYSKLIPQGFNISAPIIYGVKKLADVISGRKKNEEKRQNILKDLDEDIRVRKELEKGMR